VQGGTAVSCLQRQIEVLGIYPTLKSSLIQYLQSVNPKRAGLRCNARRAQRSRYNHYKRRLHRNIVVFLSVTARDHSLHGVTHSRDACWNQEV
jgi:hypothetical protein